MQAWRTSSQALMPAHTQPEPDGQYDIYPSFPVESGAIALGFEALAERIAGSSRLLIDGYGGVLWESFRAQLDAALARRGLRAHWQDVSAALRPPEQIDALIAPFLGDDDPLFGTRFTGALRDFFVADRLGALQPEPSADVSILYGCGAALAGWESPLVYLDVPKNEIQFRMRAGSVRNLGAIVPADAKAMYKRAYFVDWVALNQHKAELLPRIDLIADAQRPDEPAHMPGDVLRDALTRMSRNYFRARPWFEPGPWGGQWIKRQVPQLPQNVPNYAWSFELISPENGLVFGSDGALLEITFDYLMYHDRHAVLGECAEHFGYEFPIRFDFLDTFDGGNLSIQCHPRPNYIRKHFGETFTQDETYYILDCAPDARVYLGFQDDIDPAAFRAALERSYRDATPLDVDRYVQSHPAHKHDLFLIPNGTIHCSGTDNLVLEISATPYIFTFKMYDWLRLDLDGRPRPLNIERAFDNLYFERKGERVQAELISQPAVLAQGQGWRRVHLPTHPEHFYDVHRLEFERQIDITTDGSAHVLSLVEGRSVTLETAGGMRQRFNYAETFVVPAAAVRYRLINSGPQPAQVVVAFMKPGATP
ncbi:MAG TPA: class I mannose-6-phosphate isomerase [Roseiflexaceae bacterium]|nr:class I mannose-6-phosphate isomerase [Roseiflexaceae bacterium]